MPSWLKKPLTRGEILGYFISLAGFIAFQVRGPHDALLEFAVIVIILGGLIAARATPPS